MKVRRHMLSSLFNTRWRSTLSLSERASQPSTSSVSGKPILLCSLVLLAFYVISCAACRRCSVALRPQVRSMISHPQKPNGRGWLWSTSSSVCWYAFGKTLSPPCGASSSPSIYHCVTTSRAAADIILCVGNMVRNSGPSCIAGTARDGFSI